MKIRYASAAPRTLPPIDESRCSVRHPTSAIGSNGPQVVARWASASRPRADPADPRVVDGAVRQFRELRRERARLVSRSATIREVSLVAWA